MSRLLHALCRALVTDPGCRAQLMELHPRSARLLALPAQLISLVDGADPALPDVLRTLLAHKAPRHAVIVCGGARADVEAALRGAQRRWRLTGVVEHIHVDDSAAAHVVKGARGSVVVPALADLRLDPVDVTDAELLESLLPFQQARAAELERLKAFSTAQAAVRPVATLALLAAMGAMYLVELGLGGPVTPVLVRLGANASSLTAAEPWRLVSPLFLHGSFMHLALNSYAVFVLGPFLERLLGWRRFVVLFLLSGIAGNALSALASSAPLSVGASSAVFGLMLAGGALALRPRGLVPDVLLPGLKRAAFLNLGLNVLNSFHPQVDWLAHAGGGVAGALLMGSGALLLLDADQRPHVTRAAAAAAVVALVVGVVAPFMASAPLALRQPSPGHPLALPGTGRSVHLPAAPAPAGFQAEGAHQTAAFGDRLRDPLLGTLAVVPLGSQSAADALIDVKTTAALTPPNGFTVVAAPADIPGARHPASLQTFRNAGGVGFARAFVGLPGHGVLIDVVSVKDSVWPAGPAAVDAALSIP